MQCKLKELSLDLVNKKQGYFACISYFSETDYIRTVASNNNHLWRSRAGLLQVAPLASLSWLSYMSCSQTLGNRPLLELGWESAEGTGCCPRVSHSPADVPSLITLAKSRRGLQGPTKILKSECTDCQGIQFRKSMHVDEKTALLCSLTHNWE